MPANEDESNGKKEKLKSNENVDLDLAKSQSKGKQLDEQRKTSVGPKLMRRKSIDFESRLNRMYVVTFCTHDDVCFLFFSTILLNSERNLKLVRVLYLSLYRQIYL